MAFKQYAKDLEGYSKYITVSRLEYEGKLMGYRIKKVDGLNISHMDVSIKTLDKEGYKIIEGDDITVLPLIQTTSGYLKTEEELNLRMHIMEYGANSNSTYINGLCNNIKNSLMNPRSTYAYCTRWVNDKESENYIKRIEEKKKVKESGVLDTQQDAKLKEVMELNKKLMEENRALKKGNKKEIDKPLSIPNTINTTNNTINTYNTNDTTNIIKSQSEDYATKKDVVVLYDRLKEIVNKEHMALSNELKEVIGMLFKSVVETNEILNNSIKEQERFNNYFKKSIVDMGVELANINTTHKDVLDEVGNMASSIQSERRDNNDLILNMSEVLHDTVEDSKDTIIKAINNIQVTNSVSSGDVDVNAISTLIENKIEESNKGKVSFKTGRERIKAPVEWWLAFKGLVESSNRSWKKGVSYPLIYDDRYKDMTARVIEENSIKLDENKKGVRSFKTQTLMGWYEVIDDIIENARNIEG